MATQKQIHANRLNALGHGRRAHPALLPGEDNHAFECLFKTFRVDYRPVGRLEEVLVEQMAVASWKLSRLESRVYQDQSTGRNLFHDPPKAWSSYQDEPDPQLNEPKLICDQLIARAFIQHASARHVPLRRPHRCPPTLAGHASACQ